MAKLFRYAKGDNLSMSYLEGNSETFIAGTPVKLDSSGYLVTAGSDAAEILGIAQADANNTSTANEFIPVQIATDGAIFKGTVSNAGATATAELTDLFIDCDVFITGDEVTVDIDNTNQGLIRVVGIVDPTTAGAGSAADGEVYFKIFNTYSQWCIATAN